MALGDPSFGRTFNAMRRALVNEWVKASIMTEGAWFCHRCSSTFFGEREQLEGHDEGCLLGEKPKT